MAPVDKKLQKKREAGKLNKHCLTLDEKIKILDEKKKKKMSYRVISKTYGIEKIQAANILKEEERLRMEYENFPN